MLFVLMLSTRARDGLEAGQDVSGRGRDREDEGFSHGVGALGVYADRPYQVSGQADRAITQSVQACDGLDRGSMALGFLLFRVRCWPIQGLAWILGVDEAVLVNG